MVELAIPLDDAPPRLRDVRTPGRGPFRVGDPLEFSARAVDPEEGELTDRIEWLARLEHCPPGGGCHYHGGAVGRGGSFSMTFPDHGDDTSVEVRLSVTDAAGRTVERTFRAEPRLVRVAPASEPDGVRVRLNGRGDGHEVVVGSSNLLVAPDPVGPVRWDGWDDGVRAFEREVIAPEQDTTWTARYAIRARRVAGPDRVGTAVAVSRRMWDRADTVVLARADDPADALAATPLAGRLQAPVLLTPTDGLDPRVEEELERLAPSRIVLVGGPRALGPAIAESAAAVASSVERLAGPDRFATSVAVADRLGADRAFLVRGDAKPDGSPSWADALAAGPVAARQDRAVLLAAHGMVPGPVADHLAGLQDVTLVGGPAALTEDVEAAVREEVPATDRVGGADRFETAQRIDALAPTPEPAGMWLTTGFDWPDALAAGAAAASYGERLLLLAGDPAVTTGLFEGGRLAEVSRIRVAGGPAAVPTTVWRELLEQIEAALPDLLDR